MENKIIKTEQDLKNDLCEQVSLLQSHCQSFDLGEEIFAKEIASKLTILLYDKGFNFQSVLGQLNLKDKILFLSTNALDIPGNLLPFHGLVGISVSNYGVKFHAHKHNFSKRHGPYLLSFNEYWNEKILRDVQGNFLTRGEIILVTRSQDGGSHSDSALDIKFSLIKKGLSIGWKSDNNFMENIHYAILRQIAFEILSTLELKIEKENEAEVRRKYSHNYKCYCLSGKKYEGCCGK